MHNESHPFAGKTVTLNETANDLGGEVVPGKQYRVEDYWDKLTGGSWMYADGNFAAMKYGLRNGMGNKLPLDDEVVYGKINGFGHLVHVSELGEPVS